MHCAVMGGLSVHALRCALSLVSLVFGELFFGESPSLHDLFLHFLCTVKCDARITVCMYHMKSEILHMSDQRYTLCTCSY